jgi:hypothetical protein
MVGLVTRSPASALDVLEGLGDDGAASAWFPRRRFADAARMVANGATVTVRDETGVLCLVAGLNPFEADEAAAELWFCAGPGLRRALLPSLRLADQVLTSAGEAAAPVTVFAFAGRVAGARMAAAFRFEEVGAVDGEDGRPVAVWSRRFE